MMTEATGSYLVANGQIIPVAELDNYVEDLNNTIYEVLRVIDYKPLFVGEHVDRLISSFGLIHKDISPYRNQILNGIRQLIEKNDLSHGNIRFQFNKNDTEQFRAWYVPARYPTEQQYKTGVRLATFHAARQDPNIKTRDIELRQKADELIQKQDIYEVILVNEEGFLTEGSRSNIFFIDNNLFVTPPLSFVLPGVTRQKIIELIKNNNLTIKEETVRPEELSRFSACFITSTSAKVLPVSAINGIGKDVNNKWLRLISEQYNLLIEDYLAGFNWTEI
jgi:branched-chain amino acid aminotransferase